MWRLLLVGVDIGIMSGSPGASLSGLATQNTSTSTHWGLAGGDGGWLEVPAEVGRGPRKLEEKAG